MRGLVWVSWVAFAAMTAGCGGDTESNADGTGDDGGRGGSSGRGSDAGSDDGGSGFGEAGDDSGGATIGGKSAGGTSSQGGVGGSTPSGQGGRPGKAVGGGSTRGGSPGTGGVSGAGGDAPFTPPEGCRVEEESAAASYCILRLACDDEFIDTTCKDRGTGPGFCYCSKDTGGGREYQIDGVDGAEKCRLVAEICESGAEPVGPVECVTLVESRSSSSCQVQQQCTRQLEGATGAVLTEEKFVGCESDGSGRQLCQCASSGYAYTVDGDGTTACDTVAEYCDDPVEANFDDAEVDCQPEFQSGGLGFCEAQLRCARSVEVADGVSISQIDYLDVGCGSGMSGGSSCSCNGMQGYFRIDTDEAVTGIASCTSMTDICMGLVDVEVSGEPTCTVLSQAAQVSSCDAQIECSASATAGSTEVQVFGILGANCNRVDDAWSCSCSSGAEFVDVPGADPSATAWDACTRAIETCPDLVELQFGGPGASVLPPEISDFGDF